MGIKVRVEGELLRYQPDGTCLVLVGDDPETAREHALPIASVHFTEPGIAGPPAAPTDAAAVRTLQALSEDARDVQHTLFGVLNAVQLDALDTLLSRFPTPSAPVAQAGAPCDSRTDVPPRPSGPRVGMAWRES